MKLSYRTIKNALFNTLSWVFPLLLSFFFLPYIVSKLGADAYGILTLVLTVIGYFAVLDLGLGNAVIKFVAEYTAAGDSKKTNEVIGTILLVLGALGLIGGLAIFLLAKLLVTKFLKIPPHLISVAYISFCIGSAGFLVTMFFSAYSAIPNGLNRYDITSFVTLVMGTVTMLGTVSLLYLGYGILHVVCLNFVITAGGVLTYPFILRRLKSDIRLKPVLNAKLLRQVLSFGMFSLLSRIAYLLNYQADRLVTGAILGISSVTFYVVPFTLVNRLTSITVRIGSVIFPAISELQGRNQFETINDLYIVSSRVILVITTSICLPLVVFGGRFLTLWMGPEFGRTASTVLILITLALYINSFTNIPSFVVDGLGKPKITGIAAIASAILNVSLLVPLTRRMGIVGVSTAFLISNVIIAPLFVWYVNNKVLGITLMKTLKEAYLRPFLAGIITITPIVIFPQNRVTNLYVMVIVMMMSSLGYIIISYLMGSLPKEIEMVILGYLGKKAGKNENLASE